MSSSALLAVPSPCADQHLQKITVFANDRFQARDIPFELSGAAPEGLHVATRYFQDVSQLLD